MSQIENIFSEFEAVSSERVASYFLEPPGELKLTGRAPKSVAEAIRMVELAAENKFKVFTGSGYRFPREVADIPGVIMDFQKLSAVRMVDGRNLFAEVERGVAFPGLISALDPQGFRPPYPVGSLSPEFITTYLIREPAWDASKFPEAKLGPLEVVLADGRVQRTGAHALSLKTVPWTGEGGPYLSQWYLGSRDTYGIVVSGKILIYPRWGKKKFLHFNFSGMTAALAALKEISRRGYCQEGYLAEKAEGRSAGVTLTAAVEAFTELSDFNGREIDRIARKQGGNLEQAPDPPEGADRVQLRREKNTLPFFCSFDRAEDLWNKIKGFLGGKGISRSQLLAVSVAMGRELYLCPDWDGGEAESREIQRGILELVYPAGAFFDMLPYHLSQFMYKKDDTYYRQLLRIKRLMDPQNTLNPQEFMEFK
ncbi:MAG: FAD-binding protein [Proteobacteria bacterium]|nr:FAD-binding protein [Pseudomonadota bacterium]